MSELVYTDPLDIHLQAPSYEEIIIHPNEGKKIDVWTQTKEFSLYLEREEFMNFTEENLSVTLNQKNRFDTGSIKIKEKMKDELGQPDQLKLFRKKNFLFLKPVS